MKASKLASLNRLISFHLNIICDLCKAVFLHSGLFSFTVLGSHSSFSLTQSSHSALSVNSCRLIITATRNKDGEQLQQRHSRHKYLQICLFLCLILVNDKHLRKCKLFSMQTTFSNKLCIFVENTADASLENTCLNHQFIFLLQTSVL